MPIQTELSPRQLQYIDGIQRGLTAKQAAIEAGYSERSAETRAKRLNKQPMVKAALAQARADLSAKTLFNSEAAMERCVVGLQFAERTNNANAYFKGLELMSKLNGLLVEKHEIKTEGPSVFLALEAARARTRFVFPNPSEEFRPSCDPARNSALVIDHESVAPRAAVSGSIHTLDLND